MTDKEFLNELTKRGFTPAWYIDNFHNYRDEHQLIYPEYIQIQLDELAEQDANSTNWEQRHDILTKVRALRDENKNEALGAFGEYKEVDHYGGGEGEGEHFHVVLYFPNFDKYVRAEAHYFSYDGISYFDEEWTMVKPVQTIITVYKCITDDIDTSES